MKDAPIILVPLVLMLVVAVGMLAWAAGTDNATAGNVSHVEPLNSELASFLEENRPVSYSQDVQPIFDQRCVFCHGPNSIAGQAPNGLLLDTYENTMLGSLFLPVVQPGQPGNSSLVLLLRSGGMPATGPKLSPEQIGLIERWIAQGAHDN